MATVTAVQPSPQPDSDWWLVVAGSLVAQVLAYLAALVAFASMFVAFLAGVAGGAPVPVLLAPVGGFVLLFAVAGVAAVVGLVLPVALYLDAAAVEAVSDDWDPDPVLYAGAAALGLFTQGVPVQPAVAAYYLYRRHEHLGTP